MNNSMMLTTGPLGQVKTFRMIPISEECPFIECIFDPNGKILAIISKDTKEHFAMIDKVDDNGDRLHRTKPLKDENNQIIPNASPYRQERQLMTTFYEYYIMEEEEIKSFVKTFGANAESYDWEKYLLPTPEMPEMPQGIDIPKIEVVGEETMKIVKDSIPEPVPSPAK